MMQLQNIYFVRISSDHLENKTQGHDNQIGHNYRTQNRSKPQLHLTFFRSNSKVYHFYGTRPPGNDSNTNQNMRAVSVYWHYAYDSQDEVSNHEEEYNYN
jgi:hypothetical protein